MDSLRKRKYVDYSDDNSEEMKRYKTSDYSSLNRDEIDSAFSNEDIDEDLIECNSDNAEINKNNEFIRINSIVLENGKVQCYLCNQVLLNSSLKRHFAIHRKTKYCEKCESSYTESGFNRHTCTSTNFCERCRKKFSSKGKLDAHFRMHKILDKRKILPKTNDALVKCDECGIYISRRGFYKHMHTHQNQVQCLECDKKMNKCRLQEHLRCKCGYTCEICQRVCKTKERYDRHKKSHFYKHSCRICMKSFKHKIHMAVHYSDIHCDAESPFFQCFECDKIVKALPAHLRTHDSNPIQCTEPDCPFKLPNRSALTAHIRQHQRYKAAGIKKLVVPRGSETRTDLMRCEECPEFVAVSKSEMLLHASQHIRNTPGLHDCPLCLERGFIDLVELNVHVSLVHWTVSVGRVRCCSCLQDFEESSFKSHMKTHITPILECEMCELSFHSVKEFKNHYKKRHQKKKRHLNGLEKVRLRMTSQTASIMTVYRQRRVACLQCRARVRPQHMNLHIARQHPNRHCRLCLKPFRDECQLRDHIAISHNTVMYDCCLCGRGCASHVRLKAHLLRQHNVLSDPIPAFI